MPIHVDLDVIRIRVVLVVVSHTILVVGVRVVILVVVLHHLLQVAVHLHPQTMAVQILFVVA